MMPSVLDGGRGGLFARLVVNGVVQSAAGVGFAVAVDWMIESARTGPRASHSALLILAATAATVIVLKAWQRRDAEAFGLSYVHDLRIAAVQRALTVDDNANVPSLGPMLTRLTNDLLAIKNWLGYGIADVTIAVITIAGALIFIAQNSPHLAFSAFCGIAFSLACCGALAESLDQKVREARRQRGRLARALADRFQGRPTLQALGRTEVELKKVSAMSRTLSTTLTERGLRSGAMRATALAAFPLTLLIYAAVEGSIMPGGNEGGIAWIFVLSFALNSLQDVVRAMDYYVSFVPARERIGRLLERSVPSEPIQPANDPAFSTTFKCLTAQDVSVAPDGPAFDLEICAGDRILLIGATRATRHAMLRVLARLDKPPGGRLLVDGTPVEAAISSGRYRRLVRLVAADIPLLAGTVGGNLRKAGLSDMSSGRAIALARACGLPDNGQDLAALLAETVRDGRSSLGQIMDARLRLMMALASSPCIVLIDEPLLGPENVALWREIMALDQVKDIALVISEDSPGRNCSDWSTAEIVDLTRNREKFPIGPGSKDDQGPEACRAGNGLAGLQPNRETRLDLGIAKQG
ncbi:MAG: ABC transporter transmembrane domain-containing protein [Hyphomicrobium sp.]|nr:ABC transporter transmembrane domain-containing protein [Hyphomicrobium sp.]